MSKLHVFLDMDGVVVDFVTALLQLCGSNLKHDDIDRWDMHECMGMTDDEMWDRINAAKFDFWGKIPEYPWADALYKSLSEKYDVTYLTSPGRSPYACFSKLEHIQSKHGELHMDWVLTKQKSLLAKDPRCVLLDDSDKNCEGFYKAGGSAIIFPQPWNSSRRMANDKRVEHVLQQLHYLSTRF